MSSPKARLHLLYMKCETQPRYETVPVAAPQGSSDNALVASAALFVKSSSSQQNGFRCTLYLPDCPAVVSDVFPKKKEAEQDAAKRALEQMGKSFSTEDYDSKSQSDEEKMTALVERVGAIFSERVVMNCQPLKEHFRSAMRRKDRKYGLVPAAALAALDNKIVSLCKLLHSSADSNPAFTMAMVWEAAKLCQSVTCEKGFWIKRVDPFSADFEEEFLSSIVQVEFCSKFEAVYIPCSCDEMVTNIEIKLEPHEYYMDVLSSNLGIKDGAGIMMSRAIPRAPHGTRLYWPVPDILPAFSLPPGDSLPEPEDNRNIMSERGNCILESSEKTCLGTNKRASNLVGFPVYGGAILANVGSSWKSEGKLSCVDLSLSCYYRLLLARVPEGNYKISRDAILVAKLPGSFSSRSQWRGKLPRTLLMDFCQQHRLPVPDFSFSCSKMASDTSLVGKEKTSSSNNPYHCSVKLLYSGKYIEFESEHLYRNRIDAVQSAALRALVFLSKSANAFLDMPQLSDVCNSQVVRENGCREGVEPSSIMEDLSANGQLKKTMQAAENISGQSCKGFGAGSDPTKAIASGSIVSIAYDVSLVGNGPILKLESQEDFEFELGVGAVIGQLDSLVSGMHIGGFEHFFLPLPSLHLVLAARGDVIGKHTEFDIGRCSLRYDVRVLKSVEPPEERMESALFSPPLSKQRNEFSIQKLQEIHAKSLVDLGCGAGSLLDAILDHPTELEYIAGVDISLKSLIRASKSLHAKLGTHADQHIGSGHRKLKQAVLYEGSLAEPDSRLCGFDVATCIEVVEHMDPEPLSKAGEIILGALSPRILILSTPNIEYNVVLQKMTFDAKLNLGHCKSDDLNMARQSSPPSVVNGLNRVNVSKSHTDGPAASPDLENFVPMDSQNTALSGEENESQPSSLHILDDDDGVRLAESSKSHDLDNFALVDDSHSTSLFDDESGSQAIKLRNEDHRFEWTRAEFMEWADNLASRFEYTVEYAGVGGSEEDPGFASQIAIFTRKLCHHGVKARSEMEAFQGKQGSHSFPYREVWKYDKDGIPKSVS